MSETAGEGSRKAVSDDDSQAVDGGEVTGFLGPTYLDETMEGRLYPVPRVRKALSMPPCVVPRFSEVGSYWVPQGWLHDHSQHEAALRCPVRGPILRTEPPIDFEALVELGVLELYDSTNTEVHLIHFEARGLGYRPEVAAARRPDGGAVIVFAAPLAVLLVPRRRPKQMGSLPDPRDVVEVVCITGEGGCLVARPLAACWRFALAWGPSPPGPEDLLRAIRARDVSFLSPPTFHAAPNGTLQPGRLAHDLAAPLDAEGAELFLESLYAQQTRGLAWVYQPTPIGEHAPAVILQVLPAARGPWRVKLAFDYGGFEVGLWVSSDPEVKVEKERFIVRNLDIEFDAATQMSRCLGAADDAGCWPLPASRGEKFQAFARHKREHEGWRIEIVEKKLPGPKPKRRPHGLGSERIFRHIEALVMDAAGELHYQEYADQMRAVETSEAEALAAELMESDSVGPSEARRPPTPEEQAEFDQAVRKIWAQFARNAALHLADDHFESIRRLEIKRQEIARLSRIARQSVAAVDECLAVAENLVALRAYRLLAHQRDALRELLRRLHLGTGAILALPVGYGKTLVALLVGAALKHLGVVREPILWIGTKSTLISLRGDIQKFVPDLRVNDFTGPDREAAFKEVDLVMTTYDIVRRDTQIDDETGAFVGPLVDSAWGLLVVDEVSVVVNPRTRGFETVAALRSRARRVLLLNATLIENTTMDLWAHLEFVAPRSYGTGARFVALDGVLLGSGPEFEQAQAMIRRDVFAYTVDEKCCSDLDVRLPPKTWQPLLTVPLTPEHSKVMMDHHIAVKRWAKRHKSARRVMGDVLKLRRACHGLRFLRQELAADSGTPRADVVADYVAREAAAGHHCLVFTSWTDSLNLIVAALEARELQCDVLVGETTVDDRTRIVAKWSDSKNPPRDSVALVMQAGVGGRGLNLVGADRVVFAEPFWNPGAVHQCVGRAHRQGQRRPVEAVMVSSDALIESVVLRRAETKQRLFEAVFGGERQRSVDTLADWVEQHQVLATEEGLALPPEERAARIEFVGRQLTELERVMALRRAEANLDAMTRQQRQTWFEDRRIEFLSGMNPLFAEIGALGNRTPVTPDDIAWLWQIASSLWRAMGGPEGCSSTSR